jgi:S-adenosylmethionine:tRNA ribosyltransferase-isomerase
MKSLLDECGGVPIPPYFNREAMDSDAERYQTVFAAKHGSVAAPTAGLVSPIHRFVLLKCI